MRRRGQRERGADALTPGSAGPGPALTWRGSAEGSVTLPEGGGVPGRGLGLSKTRGEAALWANRALRAGLRPGVRGDAGEGSSRGDVFVSRCHSCP